MKCVLITGANGGIASQLVKRYLSEGHKVLAHVNKSRDKLEGIQDSNLVFCPADFSLDGGVEKLCEDIFEAHGVPDIIVNNAATYTRAPSLEGFSLEMFESLLKINLSSSFYVLKFFVKKMAQRRSGAIINLSSSNVKHGGSHLSVHYTISKSSQEILTKAFAKHFAKDNVRVNCVRIGFTDTDFHQKNSSKNIEERVQFVGLKRMASPDEMCDVIEYLASEKASFITGAIVDADGGE